MFKAVCTALIASLSASGALAQARECRDDQGKDRCAAEAQARQRAGYGVAAIEDLAQRKVRTVRAFFVDGYGRDAGLVTATRAPAEEPRVEVRFARNADGRAAAPPLLAVIAASAWNALVADGGDFDRSLAARAGESVSICLHAWMVTVEAVDAGGVVRRRTEGACDGALTVRYGFKLAGAAIAALPACAALDPEKTRNDVTRLAECAMLEGDRAAAAEALNAFNSTWFANPGGVDFARGLQYHFHEEVTFAWPGETAVTGSQKASEIWAARAGQQRFWPARIVGETADRVRIEGRIQLSEGEAGKPATWAPATMVWTRENGFGFRVRSLTGG